MPGVMPSSIGSRQAAKPPRTQRRLQSIADSTVRRDTEAPCPWIEIPRGRGFLADEVTRTLHGQVYLICVHLRSSAAKLPGFRNLPISHPYI